MGEQGTGQRAHAKNTASTVAAARKRKINAEPLQSIRLSRKVGGDEWVSMGVSSAWHFVTIISISTVLVVQCELIPSACPFRKLMLNPLQLALNRRARRGGLHPIYDSGWVDCRCR